MTDISTKDDLIRLLRDDDEIRALLKEVVTDTVSEVQRETLKEIRGMRADTNAMRADIGHLVGDNLERKIGFRLPPQMSHRLELADLEILLYQDREIAVLPELQEVITQAYGRKAISRGQRRRLLETDMIVRARRSDGSLSFYPVETSAAIGVEDVSRAEESARILTAITGMDAAPIVCGYRLTADAREYNQAQEGRRATVIRIMR